MPLGWTHYLVLLRVTNPTAREFYEIEVPAGDLVEACVSCAASTDTARWVAALRAEHKRFPGLRAELDRASSAP